MPPPQIPSLSHAQLRALHERTREQPDAVVHEATALLATAQQAGDRQAIVAIMTARIVRAEAPGNVLVTAQQSGLPRDSVVNISQLFTVDKASLTERVSALSASLMRKVDGGLTRVLDL